MKKFFLREYQRKIISKDDIADILKSGMKIYLEQGPAEPIDLIEALCLQAHIVKNLQLIAFPIPNVNQVGYLSTAINNNWKVFTSFGGRELSKAIASCQADYVPMHYSEITSALVYQKLRPDAAVIQVSHPDSAGYCNLGPDVQFNQTAVEAASVVIAQVNNNLPITCGDTGVHLSDIDYVFEADRKLIQFSPAEPSETEKQIAAYVAELIPDGSTIQIGIGNLPDAILSALMEKKDLGLHSGLVSDRMVDLIEAGVVTGRQKTLKPRKVVTTVLLGTDKVYNFCDRNPLVELYATSYTHNRAVISQIRNFISINSAIEIDLTGQINAESVNQFQISGVGGQVDWARIARLSDNGKSIVVIPSVVKGKSKIVEGLNSGTPVTTARTEADFIVTEYGVAQLRYRSIRERAKALINIAHPDFRDELRFWLKKMD